MNVLLQDLVTAQAEHRWDAPAVSIGDRVLTYGEVEQRSNQLAHVLLETNCRRGDRVAIAAGVGAAPLVALLGIYKADCTAVSLDMTCGPDDVAGMIATVAPACLLTTAACAEPLDRAIQRLQYDVPLPIGSLDTHAIEHDAFRSVFSMTDVMGVPGRPLAYRNWPDDPAQILFRATADGTPLGVVLTHNNVRQYVMWAGRHFGAIAGDRHGFHAPVHSGLAITSVFGGWATGATVLPVPEAVDARAEDLAAFIRATGLTQWCSPASTLVALADADVVHEHDFPTLRRVMWTGSIAVAAVRYWMQRLPHVTFTGLYGALETTVATSYYTVPNFCPDEAQSRLPIGHARPGEELLLLDEQLEAVPRGATGRIFIRGTGVSAGYWRNPASTGAAFLVNPHSADPSDRLYRTADFGRSRDDGQLYVEEAVPC